jgi:hypothetical protein
LGGNTSWRTEHTSVEKLGDDLCGGLKVSSNVESKSEDTTTDPSQYNSPEYYGHGTFSYYDIDAQAQKHRLPQPSKFDQLKPKK